AMQAAGIKRIISLTGHDARWSKDEPDLLNKLTHPILSVFAPKILHDGEKHLEILTNTGLDWTVLRSPVMNERGRSVYKISSKRPLPWNTINRHAVTQAMFDQLESNKNINDAPFLTRG
ncbi:MAG: NAD(P)H-binding protein, partial [bacterium]|nr:NAD(P)H-binding protein [bacterium]